MRGVGGELPHTVVVKTLGDVEFHVNLVGVYWLKNLNKVGVKFPSRNETVSPFADFNVPVI